ncbi:MAG: hypothetical protein U1E56_13750 [Bauldia sp.]
METAVLAILFGLFALGVWYVIDDARRRGIMGRPKRKKPPRARLRD